MKDSWSIRDQGLRTWSRGGPPREWLRRVRVGILAAQVMMLQPFSAAMAAGAPDVEAIVKNGIDLRRRGRDAEALAEFQRAARLQESARVIAQMGLAEQALGLWTDAHEHLTKALLEAEDPWISKNRPALVEAQAAVRGHLCEIEVWGGPKGAQVGFDGVVAGRLPVVSTWLLAGSEASLEVTAPGYVALRRSLKIPTSGAGRSREHVELRLVSAAAPNLALAAIPSDRAGGSPSTESDSEATVRSAPIVKTPEADSDTASSDDSPIYHRWWFWTAVGVVAAGAGVGGYVLTHPQKCTNCF